MDTPSSKALDATLEITPDSFAARTTRLLGLNLATNTKLTLHEQQLLRVRLKVASFALFLGFMVAFGFYAFGLANIPSMRLLISHILTTATLGLSSLSLCRDSHANQTRLRIEEAIVFGMPASFFALLNVTTLQKCAAEHQYLTDPYSPWVLLAFTYALFIPNRLSRATMVIASIAVAPLVILGVMMLTNTVCQQAHNANMMFWVKGLILMTMTAIIASIGAARIGVLRKEVFAAKELGQYKLKELIGRGGMGEVYLAEHQLMKRPCAVKLIRQEKASDPHAIARFENEVQTAANLTHWNSVNVYDYGHADDGTFYFVMEYLPGMSLQQLVDRYGPLPAGRTIYFLRQICNALQEAHNMRLVHRDLKPANIFAAQLGGEYDVAKLLDFGLVKHVNAEESAATMLGTIAGSPLFMAPESATGDSEPDERSDIYSLGSVAYFMLTGQPPFPGSQPIKILLSHANDQVTPLREQRGDIPEDLERIVLQCLEKDPADRPQSVVQLERMLADCSDVNSWSRDAANSWWTEQGRSIKSELPVDLAPTIG